MGKPGSRTTHFEIIDRPEFSTPWRKAAEGGITAALWALWVYLILPVVVTLLVWLGGIHFAYEFFFSREHIAELRGIIQNGGVAILAVFFIHSTWIFYNYHFVYRRFRGRRKNQATSIEDKAAKFFGVDPATAAAARLHNRFEITLTGRRVEISSATTVSPSLPRQDSASS